MGDKSWRAQQTNRDRPKPISLVSAVTKTVAETRDTYTAVTEPYAKRVNLVSAETVAESENQKQSYRRVTSCEQNIHVLRLVSVDERSYGNRFTYTICAYHC